MTGARYIFYSDVHKYVAMEAIMKQRLVRRRKQVAENRAFMKGTRAKAKGHEANNPYPIGGKLYKLYNRGYRVSRKATENV